MATLHLDKLIDMINVASKAVSAQMEKLSKEGTALSVTAMLKLQLTMNKFSQITDLGSTTITLFNRSFSTMISNVLR